MSNGPDPSALPPGQADTIRVGVSGADSNAQACLYTEPSTGSPTCQAIGSNGSVDFTGLGPGTYTVKVEPSTGDPQATLTIDGTSGTLEVNFTL